MKNPIVTLSIDMHRETPMVSLRFEKDFLTIDQRLQRRSSKSTEICTRVAEDSINKFKILLDDTI